MVSGVQFPSFSLVPPARENSWEEVRDLCSGYGLQLDPWQENVLRAALGERADGRWSASRVGLSVPRQNGKTAIFEARELAGLIIFGEDLIVHSAHLVPTALEAFERIKGYFENYDDLRRKVRSIRESNGEQSIRMMSGQRLLFKARARGAGRGFSADLIMLDEAQILGERAWAAMLPTMSARPNPQAWLAGTPPRPEDDGEVFTTIRKAAQKGTDRHLCWMEWSASGDPTDRGQWAVSNPGLGRRIRVSAIEDEYNSMSAATFSAERMGRWSDGSVLSVFPPGAWAACAASLTPREGYAMAIDATPDGSAVSIGYAWRVDDGSFAVDVDHTRAVRKVVPRVVEEYRRAGRGPVVLCGKGAVAFRDDLEAAGLEVVVMNLTDMVAACSQFFASVAGTAEYVRDDGEVVPAVAADLSHRDVPVLNAAVAGAVQKETPDGWHWNRRGPVDISPLVAVTGARWALARSTVDLSDEELLMSFW
jgi:hypothetical protein